MTGPVVNSKRLAWHKMGERHGRAGEPATKTFPSNAAAVAYKTGYRVGQRERVREAATPPT